MQRIKQIGSMACTAMAVFLFSFSVSLSASKDYPQALNESISKSGKLPVNPDSQFPFEQMDEETGDEFQDTFSMACVPAQVLSFISINDQFCCEHWAQRSDKIIIRVPIYLAKRALII
jgi:hypothetical protein